MKPKRSSRLVGDTSPPAASVSRCTPATDCRTVRVGSSSPSPCVRCATRTVLPRSTRPASGSASPVSSVSIVVLPAPFGPSTPTRSPGPEPRRHVSSSTRPPRRTVTSCSSSTFLPSRAVASRDSASRSRGAGRRRSARSPRRSGTSACSSWPAGRAAARRAPCAAGSAACASVNDGDPVPLGPGQHVRRVPALVRGGLAVVHLPHAVAHGVEEPPVVRDDDQRAAPLPAEPGDEVVGQPGDRPRCRGGWSARRGPAGPGSPMSRRASAARRRSPPESRATSVPRSSSPSSAPSTSRARGSDCPHVLGLGRRAPPPAR